MKRLLLMLLLLFGTFTVAGAGDFEDGMAAFQNNDYATAFAKFTKTAEAGNAAVPSLTEYIELAKRLNPGYTTKEITQHYYEDFPSANAQLWLAIMYVQGKGVPQDFKKAVHWYTKAAAQGHATAQFNLALMYESGRGVTQDPAQAEHWYTKAAEAGNANAQFRLSLMYSLGPSLETGGQYSIQAVRWLTKNAEAGDTRAQFTLAAMYANARGVPKDDVQAAHWYTKLAEHGDALAQLILALMYEQGQGVPQDFKRAVHWRTKAAEQGHANAQFTLGVMYDQGQGVPQDYVLAVRWFTKAAEQGDTSAQFNLALMYYGGRGVPQDYVQAVRWYTKAAEQGDTSAQFNLASMYAMGQGVPQDYVLAHMWANLAALKNNDYVKKRDAIARSMTSYQIAEAQKLAREWKPTTTTAPAPRQDTGRSEPTASGTGFVVSRQGHVLTNHHVIEGCQSVHATVEGSKKQVAVVGTDTENDLAILKLPAPVSSMARFRDGRTIRSGDGVVVVGFPLHGLLASGANVTTGTVSALAGIGNNTRFLQITAPVQPGNSGGPLLDQGGNVVGIVVSKLNAMKVAKVTGDIPQNINFAINGAVAKSFLDANSVEYELASSNKRLESSDVGSQAKKFTLLLECFK